MPTFVVGVSADEDIYPSDFDAQFEASAAIDKEQTMIDSVNHSLKPVGGGDAATMRKDLMDVITDWTLKRFAP